LDAKILVNVVLDHQSWARLVW